MCVHHHEVVDKRQRHIHRGAESMYIALIMALDINFSNAWENFHANYQSIGT